MKVISTAFSPIGVTSSLSPLWIKGFTRLTFSFTAVGGGGGESAGVRPVSFPQAGHVGHPQTCPWFQCSGALSLQLMVKQDRTWPQD